MSVIDHLTDRDIEALRHFLSRGHSVFCALEARAIAQQRDYPGHRHDAAEYAKLAEDGKRLFELLGGAPASAVAEVEAAHG